MGRRRRRRREKKARTIVRNRMKLEWEEVKENALWLETASKYSNGLKML